jgi:hypothetical protein
MAGNPWLSFLKAYRSRNPGKSMKEAMKSAAVEYRKKKGGAKGKKKKAKK